MALAQVSKAQVPMDNEDLEFLQQFPKKTIIWQQALKWRYNDLLKMALDELGFIKSGFKDKQLVVVKYHGKPIEIEAKTGIKNLVRKLKNLDFDLRNDPRSPNLIGMDLMKPHNAIHVLKGANKRKGWLDVGLEPGFTYWRPNHNKFGSIGHTDLDPEGIKTREKMMKQLAIESEDFVLQALNNLKLRNHINYSNMYSKRNDLQSKALSLLVANTNHPSFNDKAWRKRMVFRLVNIESQRDWGHGTRRQIAAGVMRKKGRPKSSSSSFDRPWNAEGEWEPLSPHSDLNPYL